MTPDEFESIFVRDARKVCDDLSAISLNLVLAMAAPAAVDLVGIIFAGSFAFVAALAVAWPLFFSIVKQAIRDREFGAAAIEIQRKSEREPASC